MQDVSLMYIDFILTMHRSMEFLDDILKKKLNYGVDILLSLYYFDDHLTNEDHLMLKGFSFSANSKIIESLIEEELLRKVEPEGKYELTAKGIELKAGTDFILCQHSKQLLFNGLVSKELGHVLTIMNRFSSFWEDMCE